MYFPAFFFLFVSVIVMKISSTAYHQHIYQLQQQQPSQLLIQNTINTNARNFLVSFSMKLEFIWYVVINYFIQFCLSSGIVINCDYDFDCNNNCD